MNSVDFNLVLQKSKQEKLRLKMFTHIKYKYVKVYTEVHYTTDMLKCRSC